METELEAMVVKMIGDASEFLKMLQDSSKAAQSTAAEVKTAAGQIEGFSNSLKGFAQSAVGALSSIGISLSAMSAFFKFDDTQRGVLRLNAAITAGGHDAATVAPGYVAFAKSIEDVTLTSKGMVLGMLQVAESMGLSGAAAERAIRNAVALAAANGGSADSFVRQTVALEHGNAEMLSRILPLRHITDETQKAAEAQRLLGNMFSVSEAEATTAGGRLERLGRSIGSIVKEVGGMISEVISPMIDVLRQAVDWFKALDPAVKQTTLIIAGLLAGFLALSPILSTLGGMVATVFSPMSAVVLAIGIAVAAWVRHMGGVAPAVAYVKERFEAMWAFIRPVVMALGTLFKEVWAEVRFVIKELVEIAGEAWSAIFGDAKINWTEIRDYIHNKILEIAFAMRNFGTMIEIEWLKIKYKAMLALDTIKNAFPILTAVAAGAAAAIGESFAIAWESLYNPTVFRDAKDRIVSAFSDTFGSVSEALGVHESEGTASAGGALRDAQNAMMQSWERFRTDHALNAAARGAGENLGTSFGDGLTNAAKDAMKSLDHVLFGSAESRRRIDAYQDLMSQVTRSAAGAPPAAGTVGMGAALPPASIAGVGAAIVGIGATLDAPHAAAMGVTERYLEAILRQLQLTGRVASNPAGAGLEIVVAAGGFS